MNLPMVCSKCEKTIPYNPQTEVWEFIGIFQSWETENDQQNEVMLARLCIPCWRKMKW